MGAYCQFCGHRCFVIRMLPDGSWSGCMATCAAGMEHDRKQTGHDHTTAINTAETTACGFCGRPTATWPGKDCEQPEEHVGATYGCDCGETVTIEQALADPRRHRRCNLIGASS